MKNSLFTPKTDAHIKEIEKKISSIFGYEIAGINYNVGISKYGKAMGDYNKATQTVNLATNPTFNVLVTSKHGYAMGEAFEDVLIHELCHHMETLIPKPTFKGRESDTHKRATWCTVVATYWKHIDPTLDIDGEILARGIRKGRKALTDAVYHFPDTPIPYEELELIPRLKRISCHNCKQTFVPKRVSKKFCSNKCRLQFNRKNKDK